MENSKYLIERALRENSPSSHNAHLFEDEIKRVAQELESCTIYLDEMSRQRLLYQLEWGRIDAEEFKRRALNNDPMGLRGRATTRLNYR
jgi:hypothetical protein